MLSILIAALIAVESAGNPNAIGDGGKAVGILQIHPSVIADVNRIANTNYSLDDRKDAEKSKQICTIYLTHYVTAKRIGHEPTAEDFARCWNGGPNGYKKAATIGYWQKVKREIEKRQ
jgi:soluble lytic murein transglycosylase-like protein